MGYSKAFVLFGLFFAVTVLISSRVYARELAETTTTQTQSVEDAKYGGYGGGSYGHGGGGYGGGSYGHGGGSYGHGGGGYGGGSYGHGGGGYGHGGGGYGHGGGGYGHGGGGGHYPPKAEKTTQENGN